MTAAVVILVLAAVGVLVWRAARSPGSSGQTSTPPPQADSAGEANDLSVGDMVLMDMLDDGSDG